MTEDDEKIVAAMRTLPDLGAGARIRAIQDVRGHVYVFREYFENNKMRRISVQYFANGEWRTTEEGVVFSTIEPTYPRDQ